jgi:subtilisin family serine protease
MPGAKLSVAALGLVCAFAAGPAAAQISTPRVHPRRVIVRYRATTSADAERAVARRLGLRERKHLRFVRLRVLEVGAGATSQQALAELRAQPEVESVAPDVQVHTAVTPDDPGFDMQWGLHDSNDTDIDAPAAWDMSHDASNVVVAVVDSGLDYRHEDLVENVWQNPGESANGSDDDGDGYVDDLHGINCIDGSGDPNDDEGHGTHVAGTIGAVGGNAIGVTGVAWRTQLMALKFIGADGNGWDSDAIECLDYAIMMKTTRGVNVRVINASWGSSDFDPALRDALQAAQNAGILTVAAAGNSGANHDLQAFYPASFALDGVIAVAATTQTGALASFSDYGSTTVQIAAPGQFILSTLPGDRYGYLSGTSMASPHVAGAAALVASQSPGISVHELRMRLLDTADRTPALKNSVVSGRLNLAAALQAAGGAAPPASTPIGDAPVAGSRLTVSDFAAKPEAAKWSASAKDPAIALPASGSSADPSENSGVLRLSNPVTHEAVDVALDAAGWTFAHKSYVYTGQAPCRVALKAGKLSAKCSGPSARFALEAAAQQALDLELSLGTGARFCARFGGTLAKDYGIGFGPKPSQGVFKATLAPAPDACPAP